MSNTATDTSSLHEQPRQPTQYAMGFMLSEDRTRIALIRKNRPALIAGLLTGIGGHREEGEAFAHCVVREFAEEAGVQTNEAQWQLFAVVDNDRMFMPCFTVRTDRVALARTMEDEPIQVYDVSDLKEQELAPLAWSLIVQAMGHERGDAVALLA